MKQQKYLKQPKLNTKFVNKNILIEHLDTPMILVTNKDNLVLLLVWLSNCTHVY